MFRRKTEISSSSGVTPALASTTQIIAWDFSIANPACLKIFAGIIASSSGTMPPVSTSSNVRDLHSTSPKMRSRVMPGSSPTIDFREPVSRLKSVDLPTLGRPIIATSGAFIS